MQPEWTQEWHCCFRDYRSIFDFLNSNRLCGLITKSDRIRFLRTGGFGRAVKSNDEQLLNSDVNDATLISTT